MPAKLELDWASADVSQAMLTVGLSQKPPKKWRDAFERTVVLLNHGKWRTELDRKKAVVEIAPVQAGDEERVRVFLEGAILEANATIVGEDELFDDKRPGGEDGQAPEQSADAEIAARFRAFAQVDG
jgi:hypothetical protein